MLEITSDVVRVEQDEGAHFKFRYKCPACGFDAHGALMNAYLNPNTTTQGTFVCTQCGQQTPWSIRRP